MDNSFTDLQTRQEVSKSMCRLTHKTQGGQGYDCKVRQDIIPKVGSKVKKTMQNMADAKSRLQLYGVNLKVDVPRPPRGVDVKK